ncbi:MAG: TraB/GumN family protein [Saprospiraceae bacterium]
MKSVKSLQYFFFVLWLGFLVIGGQSGCKSSKNLAQTKDVKSLLWEIKVPGASESSYVFGTIHLIAAEDYFLPDGTMTAFEKSEKVFFEIDVEKMTDITSMMGIMNKLYMNDGLTLKDLLNDKDYEKVSQYFSKKGLPIFFLERMKPMFLTALTYGDVGPEGLQNGDMKSYEFEFLDMAKNTKKQTGGLETIEFQIGVFDKIPYEKQAQMLLDAISQSNEGSDELDMMVQMYKDQDIEKMSQMISDPSSDIADYGDILVTERNNNWIPILMEESKKQSSFFAVGAGHLGGKDGVINLLKKQGVKVQPFVKNRK